MKKIVIIFAFLVLGLKLFAQPDFHKSRITADVGSSFMGLVVNVVNESKYEMINDCYATPLGQLSYEYFVDEKVSVGIAANYQFFRFNVVITEPQVDALDIYMHRFNIGARGMFHYYNSDVLHFYSGARLGLTTWMLNANSASLRQFLMLLPVRLPFNPEIRTAASFFSAQLVLFGMDVYFTENIGFTGEICIGPTYTMAAGLSFRF